MFKKSPSEKKDDKNERISMESFRQRLSESKDIVMNTVAVNSRENITVGIVYVDGMVNTDIIDDFIFKPLIQEKALSEAGSERGIIDFILLGTVYHGHRILRETMTDSLNDLLSGSVLIVFDGARKAVSLEAKGFDKRGITEPTNENVLKGSKESFIEVLRTNTALIRRRIQSPDLTVSQLTVGKRTRTTVAVVYLKGIADQNIVDQVTALLEKINIDSISSPGQIESFLLDNKISFFPQLLYTERVDKLCGNILEGRVGILIDGLPLAYIVPVDINSFLQAPEDYSVNYIVSSLFRILRYISAFLALILPSVYVAVTTFHPELIPTKLAVSIIGSKQGVPFPVYLEVILMLLAFEVLLEAGLRLPKSIGQTVSIVGALVVGQAAIAASILSPAVVIVIATAGITGFVIPSQDMANAIRICRMGLVFLSMIGGMATITMGLIAILYHLCSLEIFGLPYLSPYAANEGKQLFGDTIIRLPWFTQKKRPINVNPQDTDRAG